MARRQATLAYECISVEGGLFPAEWFTQLAAAQLPNMAGEDYRLPAGLQLRDEISRGWTIARAWWQRYERARAGHEPDSHLARKAAAAFTQGWFREVLGYQSLEPLTEPLQVGERRFPLSFSAVGGRVPVLVAAWEEPLDAPLERLKDGRRRSPFGLLQDYLNAEDRALWGIVTNGRSLRLLRDNAALTRPTWVEVDLERLFSGEFHADFAALWLLLHETRFGLAEAEPEDCWLEQQRAAGLKEGTRAREKLSTGVTEALKLLGIGFLQHATNEPLREALRTGALTPQGYYAELLRLVYRLIFVVTVEERGLLHPPGTEGSAARRRYAEGYALLPLRERAARSRPEDGHHDLWLRLQVVLSGLAAGQAALALPAFGGLFEPGQCPHLDRSLLSNAALLGALRALTWVPVGQGIARVNWRDMGSEELGSVYESLLELEPAIRLGEAQPFRFLNDDDTGAEGNARKRSGSYYTPDSLVQCLLDSTLEPVIVQRVLPLAGEPDKAAAELLSLSVIDPACGSGHFLLGAARRLAVHLVRLRTDGTPSASEYRHALRQVVTHCLYGNDRNALAIELARMALWLEAATPDAPLGFVDHHLRHGDALLGLIDLAVLSEGIPDEAFDALGGDDKATSKSLKQRNRKERLSLEALRTAGPQLLLLPDAPLESNEWVRLEQMPDDAPDQLAAKRTHAKSLSRAVESSGVMLAANLYVAAFLLPKKGAGDAVPTTQHVLAALQGQSVPPAVRDAALSIGQREHFTHWKLTFPQVFARGGFDVVIGNPPWKILSELNTGDEGAVTLADQQASEQETEIHQRLKKWYCSKDFTAADGRRDLYKLFVSRIPGLLCKAGLAGLVLPIGILFEEDAAALRRLLFQECSVPDLVFIQNSAKTFFPSVHASYRLALYTIARTSGLNHRYSPTIKSHAGLRSGARIEVVGPALSNESDSIYLGGIFSSAQQAKIHAALMSRLSAIKKVDLEVFAELHSTTDKKILSSVSNGKKLALVSSGTIHYWNPYFNSPKKYIDPVDLEERQSKKGLNAAAWRYRNRLVFRDYARNDDTRTMICCWVPPNFVSTYDAPMLIQSSHQPFDGEQGAFYSAWIGSMLFDFLLRPYVDKHVKPYVLARVPVPQFEPQDPVHQSIVRVAQELLSLPTADERGKGNNIDDRRLSIEKFTLSLLKITREEFLAISESFPRYLSREQEILVVETRN